MRRHAVARLTASGRDARDVGAAARPAAAPARAARRFRSDVNLILVDVVVRDRSGAVVQGPDADDFQLLEDGKPQQIVSFAFEQIATTAAGDRDRRRSCRPRRSRRCTVRGRRLPARRRPRAADIGGRCRPSAADAALRHELDAAGGRAEGRRLGARRGSNDQMATVRSRRRRDDRLDARRC